MSIDREAWLQVCAYYMWESEGRPEGRDRAHWAAAERVLAEIAAAPVTRAAKPRTRGVKAALAEAISTARQPVVTRRRKKAAAEAVAPSL